MSDSTVTTAHPVGLTFPQADDDNGGDDATGGLSPWPTAEPARSSAISRLRSAIGGRAANSDEDADHLGAVASALVEDYAPTAPQALRDEAVIRFAGYLSGADYGGIRSETGSPGRYSLEYVVNHGPAFRNSGAAMLLSRYRARRAGRIEGTG